MAKVFLRLGLWCTVGALALLAGDFEYVKGGNNWPALIGYLAGTIAGGLLVAK